MFSGQNPNQLLPDNGFAFAINPKSPTRDAVASFVQKKLDSMNDPARISLPPLAGEDLVPHALTFASMIGAYSQVYMLPDESVEGMAQDARLMREDLGIMECIEIRQRMVAELDWEIEPPDKKNASQLSLAAELTQILKSIRRFTEYRRCMQEAIWVGRSGIQHRYGNEWCGHRQYKMPKPLHQDNPGWKPIHGDKIVYRFDDGRVMKEGAYPDQLGIRIMPARIPEGRHSIRQRAEPTAHGMAVFLRPYERETMLVHKHMIEDSDFYDSRQAGRIHGVGIRSRIRKTWILKQETLAFLMRYLERSAGGIEIWNYPSGDSNAKAAVIEAAENRMANGRNMIFFPKPLGEDAALFDLQIVEPGFAGIDLLNSLQDKYFGHQIKRYILGQTLTTEADATGLGSNLAEIHKDTLSQIIIYDGDNHAETLTEELVGPIQKFNFPETMQWKMRLKLQYETEDSKEKMEGYRAAWDMGARIKEQDVLDMIGAVVPGPDDRLLSNPSFQQPGGDGGSQFGTFPSGTSVVSAAVHQSMGAHMGGTGPMSAPGQHPATPGRDGDGDGVTGDGTSEERPEGAVQYARRSDRLLAEAARKTHTTPSEAQTKAGNYSKGIFRWNGMEIAIENPKGSERRGTSSSGREWSRTMACHYGYFRRTEASDGDALDVFIGSHPDSDFVLVIKQLDSAGKFDEFKIVIGCLNRKQAKRLYLSNYPKGWKCGPAASMTTGIFKKWVEQNGPVKAKSITADS